ncbi:MAG: Lrp/AsnC family transcriptional regulator [Phycisphaerales bacterium]|nr:Lrp/AsnC family transcriptional regulator [Phycisphaerales bacterium]
MTTDSATPTVPIHTTDDINARILAVSEDRIQGFQADPLGEIARQSGVELPVVIERIRAMLQAGTIRRVRQTLMSINLASGGLVAWVIPEDRLSAGFEFMFHDDPFSGHIVIRSTDKETTGSKYRLWTTLKVPQGYSMEKHCRFLCSRTGATAFKIMPAHKVFALGVGHVRRKNMEPGSRAEVLAEPHDTVRVTLSELDWQVLTPLKREFEVDEIAENLWEARAREAGVSLDEFYRVARSLQERGVIGRFSTFLEHAKPLASGERVTKFNALFHWAVPEGREIEAGKEVGCHHIMTHAYWREGGEEFAHVNVMGVIHGTDKAMVLAHKKAIDEHLAAVGIPVSYTNVFWGGRSEIKPSEISPFVYREWCRRMGVDAETMRE